MIMEQNSNDSKDIEQGFTIANLYSLNDYLLIRPNILWKDGKTFFCGNESNTFSNTTIYICRYNHFTTSFFYQTVGNGTDVQDAFNHPQAYLWIEGNTIYTGQSNPHNGTIDLFRSEVADDINGTFTELTPITGGNAYVQFYMAFDNKLTINIRTGSSSPNFNLAVNRSNSSSIEGIFTLTQITANTENNYRYYNQSPVLYGTNTKHYFIANRRNETTQKYWGQCALITTDFQTFSNYQGTASKNVVSVAPFTNAEIDANYMINGSSGSDTDDLGFMSCIQVNDVFYGIAIKSGTTNHYIFKIDGNTMTETLINIPNMTRGNGLHEVYLYYNGNNILISCLIDDTVTQTKEIWASPLDLTSFVQKYVYEGSAYGEPITMTENIDEVIGEHMIHIDMNYGLNQPIFYLTTDKFYI